MSGPAWSNQVQNQVIVGGPGGGLFVYNGTPALGNPPVFYVTSASTDPFGNPVTPLAATSQVGGNIVQLINGLVRFPAGGGNGFLGSNAAGVIQLNSGSGGVGDTSLDVLFRSKNLSSGGAAPAVELPGPGSIIVADEISAWNPGRTAPETWHDLGTLAGYTVNRAQYKLGAENQTWLFINVTSGGANAATVTFSNTLAAAYRPPATVFQPLTASGASTSPPRVSLSSAGAVSITQQANNAIQILGVMPVPLD